METQGLGILLVDRDIMSACNRRWGGGGGGGNRRVLLLHQPLFF